MTPFLYATLLTAIVAGCWFAGPPLEKLIAKAPWFVKRLAYMTLALAMVRGLMRFFV